MESVGMPGGHRLQRGGVQVGEGRLLGELRRVASEEVARWVGSVPEGKEHCPELAAEALRSVAQR